MKAETEIWQVQTHDGLYQTDLPTLKQWVAEGAVLATDRVRKGSLNWIEAGRAPMLRRVFSGEEQVEAAADASQTEQQPPTDLGLAADAPPVGFTPAQSSYAGEGPWDEPVITGAPALSSSCHF